MEIRSPELSSMSTSRVGWTALTSAAKPDQLVGGLAHGADHHHHVVARAPGPGHVVGHGPDPVGVGDRGPAELLHHQRHGRQGYRGVPRRPWSRDR